MLQRHLNVGFTLIIAMTSIVITIAMDGKKKVQ